MSLFLRIFLFVNILGISINIILYYFFEKTNIFLEAIFRGDTLIITGCILSYIVLSSLLYFCLEMRKLTKNLS